MYPQSNVVNTVGWRRRRARHCWRRPTGAPVPYSMPARSRNAAARSPSLWGYRQIAGGARTLTRGARRSALPAPRRLAGHLPRAPTVASAGALVQSRRRAACANPAASRACRPRAATGGDHGRFALCLSSRGPRLPGDLAFPLTSSAPERAPVTASCGAPSLLSAGPESLPGRRAARRLSCRATENDRWERLIPSQLLRSDAWVCRRSNSNSSWSMPVACLMIGHPMPARRKLSIVATWPS